jgi:Protein of unknown function (DUF3617)
MRANRTWITLTCCFVAAALLAWAQNRKPGLWEVTSTQTWQQSPLPPGAPTGPNSPFSGGTHTNQVCLTQEQIDKYDAVAPSMHSCQITNVVKNAHGMTADLVCTGRMSGKGTVEAIGVDEEHAKGKVHFTGSIQVGSTSRPVEWTVESSSVFKSSDCGSVKPVPAQ